MNNKINKTENKPIQPAWTTGHSYLNLNFDYEDVNESIESLVERGARNNPRVLIDQINAARVHILCRCSPTSTKHLLSVIDYFLKNGIDVNAKGEERETVLMAAASYCSADIVRLLLQNGANVNDKNDYGGTAILTACGELNIEAVKLLLENGAEVDSDCFLYIFDLWDPSDSEMQIQIELSKLLLDKNISINSKHGNGKTALMYIAEAVNCNADYYNPTQLEKQTELVQFILDKGADINARDSEGKTALMYAIEAQNKNLAEYLLEQGADANIKDKEGGTALTYAKHFGVRIIGKLRKKMDRKKAASIFELTEIEYRDSYDENDETVPPQYPDFEINRRRVGLYSTLAKAEQGIKEYIQTYKPKDTFGFWIEESELDKLSFWWTKSIRNYLPDGSFLDECPISSYPIDNDDLEEFFGRRAEKVRFQNGDLAEELRGDTVMLVIIGNSPCSPEEINRRRTKWKMAGFHLDFSDDCYYALSVCEEDEDDTHSHPMPINLFPLRFPVSDEMRSNLEKQYLRYREQFGERFKNKNKS